MSPQILNSICHWCKFQVQKLHSRGLIISNIDWQASNLPNRPSPSNKITSSTLWQRVAPEPSDYHNERRGWWRKARSNLLFARVFPRALRANSIGAASGHALHALCPFSEFYRFVVGREANSRGQLPKMSGGKKKKEIKRGPRGFGSGSARLAWASSLWTMEKGASEGARRWNEQEKESRTQRDRRGGRGDALKRVIRSRGRYQVQTSFGAYERVHHCVRCIGRSANGDTHSGPLNKCSRINPLLSNPLGPLRDPRSVWL